MALEKAVDGTMRIDDFINNPGYYAYWDGWNYPLKKSSLAKTIKRLREKGLIDFVSDNELIIKLTDPGKDKALWAKMMMGDKKWDGKWRLIIWDIPEKRRQTRDLLRMKLKQLGFVRWQKSVWASKINCTNILREFVKKVGIGDWVMVLESDNVSG
ncbi:CRISPR-associated endonuclease Cas2 [Candidatus Microgenomates bacterium]|nr:CRISPR-associated endonuclease Cas2 [Candidatus Microgenomates bacterium]